MSARKETIVINAVTVHGRARLRKGWLARLSFADISYYRQKKLHGKDTRPSRSRANEFHAGVMPVFRGRRSIYASPSPWPDLAAPPSRKENAKSGPTLRRNTYTFMDDFGFGKSW